MTETVFDKIDGEEVLRDLVEHLYDLVEARREGAQIVWRHMEGHEIAATDAEQFNFFSGFFRGRQYYKKWHGHMTVKHIPIMQQDAEGWLGLMDKALGGS